MKTSNFPHNRHNRTNLISKNQDCDFARRQARFKWTDDKHINLVKYLEQYKVSWNLEIAAQTKTKSNYMKL